jgi:hypothetical protein
MIKVRIDVDSDLLQQLAYRLPSLFGAGVAPATKQAFNTSARYIQGVWKGWAMGDPLIGITKIKNPSQRLANSIRIKQNGPFNTDIYTESLYAQRIQDGTPELDMKTTHPYGPHSRITKSGPNEGIPYVIIPIRWGTPNDKNGARAHWKSFIAKPAFDIINKLKPSRIVHQRDPTKLEENYYGDQVPRNRYAWGDRHEDEGNMDGMVRMAGKGGYFTFRVISAVQLVTKPYSWIRKAVPPVDVVSALENATRPVVEEVIQAGLEADIGL